MQPTPGTAQAAPGPDAPHLTVVIPAYNEAPPPAGTLATVRAYLSRQPYAYELLVVDDGSADATAARPRAPPRATRASALIRNPHMGKGVTVRAGMLAATGRYILYSDADFSTPIEEFEKLLAWLAPGLRYRHRLARGPGRAALSASPATATSWAASSTRWCRLIALRQFADTQCGFKVLQLRGHARPLPPRATLRRQRRPGQRAPWSRASTWKCSTWR